MSSNLAPGDNPYRLVLRRAVVPTAVAGVVTSVVLALVSDLRAGVSGLIGAAIALVFFGSGMVMMSRYVRTTREPMLFMAVGMATYFAQVLVLLGVLIVARQVTALDSVAAGIAMLVCVLVWQVAQVVAWRQARLPVYDEQPAAEVRHGS